MLLCAVALASAAWAVHLVEAPSRLQGAITAMLSGVAVVPDVTAALAPV